MRPAPATQDAEEKFDGFCLRKNASSRGEPQEGLRQRGSAQRQGSPGCPLCAAGDAQRSAPGPAGSGKPRGPGAGLLSRPERHGSGQSLDQTDA